MRAKLFGSFRFWMQNTPKVTCRINNNIISILLEIEIRGVVIGLHNYKSCHVSDVLSCNYFVRDIIPRYHAPVSPWLIFISANPEAPNPRFLFLLCFVLFLFFLKQNSHFLFYGSCFALTVHHLQHITHHTSTHVPTYLTTPLPYIINNLYQITRNFAILFSMSVTQPDIDSMPCF